MTDQLFNDEQNVIPQVTPEQNPPNQNPNDLFADQLAAIKNGDGVPKYDTVEKAIEALQHSQQYIPELKDKMSLQEQEIKNLKAKLEAGQNVQTILDGQTPPTQEPSTTQTIGEKEVSDIVSNLLSRRSEEDVYKSNVEKVNKALTDKFGANAQAEVAKRAAELGMKPSELGALSKSNPTAALALFGEKVNPSSTTTNSYYMPATPVEHEPLKRPEKSVLSGATSGEQSDLMRKIKDEVYRKHNITA
jgi:hypothetical protein